MARKSNPAPVYLKRFFSDYLLMRAEREAMDRAARYAEVDPYYKGQPITVREDALMRLALRAMTEPYLTERQILALGAGVRLERRTRTPPRTEPPGGEHQDDADHQEG